MSTLSTRLRGLGFVLGLLGLSLSAPVLATSLPAQFSESLVAGGIASPTAMAFAPDGRIFVAQQNGALRVIEDGTLLATPFLTVSVDATQERGLLGVAFDPDFENNHYVYIYYTTATDPRHNRISRFTANDNVGGSETILVELENLSSATNHNGGALHFGPDGKLYAAVGDNANGSNAQTLNNRLGKMLRLNSDGSIPTDNPFYNTATGANRAIWAFGLRNPFTFAFQPGTGRMFINEVGQSTWEEINDGIAGANYGWPTTEGPTSNPQFRSPVYAYQHSGGGVTGCAITGGAFYNPPTVQFPANMVGSYFFADYCANWIRRYDPVADTVHNFASATTAFPVDIRVGDDGSLYYLARGLNVSTAGVYRISYTPPTAPVISLDPSDQIVAVGDPATFTCRADGSPTPTYRWQRNTINIPNATRATYTLSAATLSDNGAQFRCVATNSLNSATSENALLTVIDGQRPTATINVTLPNGRTLYHAGDTIHFSGTANDAEDGVLPAAAYTWEVVQHHDTHIHPGMAPVTGVTSESFDIGTSSHGAVNIWYRIILTVVDSDGLTRRVQRDVFPQVVNARLISDPPGLELKINGEPRTTPRTIQEIIGVNWFLEAPSPQIVDGIRWEFEAWSDGGAASHLVVIPNTPPTYTAEFFGCPVIPNPAPNNAAPLRNYFEDSTPTLTWGRVSWAVGYEVQVDNERDFSDPEFQTDVLTTDQLEVTTDELRDCTYYWRVRAKNSSGRWGSWSRPDTFIVNAIP